MLLLGVGGIGSVWVLCCSVVVHLGLIFGFMFGSVLVQFGFVGSVLVQFWFTLVLVQFGFSLGSVWFSVGSVWFKFGMCCFVGSVLVQCWLSWVQFWVSWFSVGSVLVGSGSVGEISAQFGSWLVLLV